jgi:hypothetical protein
MCVFIVRAKATSRTLHIQFSSPTCFGPFGHRHIDFITTYMENITERKASYSYFIIHIRIHIHTYIHIHIHIHMHIHTHTHARIHIHMHILIHITF